MRIRIGLIGSGNISETHAKAASQIAGAEIVGVYGTNATRVKHLSREYGAKAFSEFDAFLSHRPMDMVMIGTPSGLHGEQGIAAIRSGLHVLTEKPMDITTARADAFIQAADERGAKVGVIFQDRLKPEILQLKQSICAGDLGKITLVDARVKWYRPPEYYGTSTWRGTFALDGGGALMNQGVHTVDLLLWLFGDVSKVVASIRTAQHAIEVEDTALAILEFANGPLCTLLATTAVYPGYPRRVEITGSEGTVILEDDRIIASHLRTSSGKSDKPSVRDEGAASHVVSDVRGHKAILEDFIQAIKQNRPPACDAREGRKSIALIESIYRAARDSRLGGSN
jgi:UDP-N-acetyl-2-amino-2-deoxyglucuronate dehydrogenase